MRILIILLVLFIFCDLSYDPTSSYYYEDDTWIEAVPPSGRYPNGVKVRLILHGYDFYRPSIILYSHNMGDINREPGNPCLKYYQGDTLFIPPSIIDTIITSDSFYICNGETLEEARMGDSCIFCRNSDTLYTEYRGYWKIKAQAVYVPSSALAPATDVYTFIYDCRRLLK